MIVDLFDLAGELLRLFQLKSGWGGDRGGLSL